MALAVPFFSSCSDDDENTAECTVGFLQDEITVSEFYDGYFNVPIEVKGLRNGPVRIKVSATPTGNTPAVEGENYVITDKTLNVNADTLSTSSVNVELRLIDDYIMNADRQFILTLETVEGAKVDKRQILVTIQDNDGDYYLAFGGDWYLNATDVNGIPVKRKITLKSFGPDEVGYGEYLTATTFNLCGQQETLSWIFKWIYDDSAEVGEFAIQVAGTPVGSLALGDYTLPILFYMSPNGNNLNTGDITAPWAVGETGIPQTLQFDNSNILMVCLDQSPAGGGLALLGGWSNITFTRE